MAISFDFNTGILVSDFVLTPERLFESKNEVNGTVLVSDVAVLASATITSKSIEDECLLIDTGDVLNGFVTTKAFSKRDDVGSTKKILQIGDVIISRLRPYLRQIGYIDKELVEFCNGRPIICSTEFYILRSTDEIGFMVPYLLSSEPQNIFNKCVEGGHHPRFNSSVLLQLPIPDQVLEKRHGISSLFISAVESQRKSQIQILKQIQICESPTKIAA